MCVSNLSETDRIELLQKLLFIQINVETAAENCIPTTAFVAKFKH